jgi:hypothetical protein
MYGDILITCKDCLYNEGNFCGYWNAIGLVIFRKVKAGYHNCPHYWSIELL